MGGEEDDVDGARGREHVLAVLVGVARQLRARDDERRCATELRGLVRAALPRRAARTSRARSPGSARARSGGGSGPSAPARAAPRRSPGRPARPRRPCVSGVTGSPPRRPRVPDARRPEPMRADRSPLIQWLAYGGPARAARGRPRPADGRGSRRRGAPRRRARDPRPRRTGSRCPASARARCPQQVLLSADRQAAPLLRGGRVAHHELVLERRAHEPRPAGRAARLQLRAADRRRRGAGGSPPSSRCRTPSSPPTGRRSRCRGSRSRSATRSSTSSSRLLQETVASLAPVDGRPAQPGDVAVVDLVSRRRPGAARLRRRARRATSVVDELEQGVRDLTPGESREVGWSSATARAATSRSRLKDLYEKVLPPLDDALAHEPPRSSTRSRSCAPTSSERIRGLLEEEAEDAVPRRPPSTSSSRRPTSGPPGSLVEMRTRDLINSFLRQLDARGIDPGAYLQDDRHQRRRARAAAAGRGRALDRRASSCSRASPTSSGSRSPTTTSAPTCARRARATRTSRSSSPPAAPTACRPDLRMRARGRPDRRRGDRDLARSSPRARESIWTPGKEEDDVAEKKLWTPGR